ncbi:hypothetical protein [Phreatobacter sp.]|uniref:hypothetical protein n=1 Tax=Phreatobacter sp. TaxID=1966341 RepID=UPI003F6E4551
MTQPASADRGDRAAAPSPLERLRTYLGALPDTAKTMLVREIENARRRGEDVPGGDLIIAAIRGPAPEPQLASRPRPPANAEEIARREAAGARALFRPLEPFLIDEVVETRVAGRIARASLAPVWTWLARDLLPADAAAFAEAADEAGDDDTALSLLVGEFLARAVPAISAALDHAARNAQAHQKLIGRLNEERILRELPDILRILTDHAAMTMPVSKLPPTIRNLAEEGLANARAILDPVLASRPDLIPYCLALIQNRLSQRAQVVRLAVSIAESDDPSKIAASPYRSAVDLVICELERASIRATTAVRELRFAALARAVKEFHDTARSLRTDMHLAGDGPWQRRLAKLRAELASLLTAELDSLPGQVRRLLRPRQKGDQPMAPIPPDTVAELETRLDLLATCRTYASEIALNELTLRVHSEIQAHLDPTLTQLMENIRQQPDIDRALKISQIDAAVRFSARIFGPSYAQLLQKAADVAIQSGKNGR